MDYRKLINWLVSPLPKIFTKDSKGVPLPDNPTIQDGFQKALIVVKIIGFSLIIYGVIKLYKLIF